MHYIVFDLEFNQGCKSTEDIKPLSNPKCPFEIIQIGALKLDEHFNEVSSLDMFIKPTLYTELNPIVEKLTGIKIETLNNSKSFKEVYNTLSDFITPDDILVVWGKGDIKELFRNILYHNLDLSLISNRYINIQSYASKYFKCTKGVNIGLSKAIHRLEIPIKDEFHNAFNDAYYTAEIFKKLYNDTIKTQLYSFNKRPSTNNTKKQTVDIDALTKQFEKMFNREMTEDEKSIIKLAYFMGKTNQFTIENKEKD